MSDRAPDATSWSGVGQSPATGVGIAPTPSVAPPLPALRIDEASVPWSTPAMPAGLITAAPGRPIRTAKPDVPYRRDDFANPRPLDERRNPPEWQLELDDGRSIPVRGPILVGRDPTTADDTELLVPVPDETRSVSKTHLRIEIEYGHVIVTDLHSTNGAAVVTAGIATACAPGTPTPVPAFATVRFGDREMRLLATAEATESGVPHE